MAENQDDPWIDGAPEDEGLYALMLGSDVAVGRAFFYEHEGKRELIIEYIKQLRHDMSKAGAVTAYYPIQPRR